MIQAVEEEGSKKAIGMRDGRFGFTATDLAWQTKLWIYCKALWIRNIFFPSSRQYVTVANFSSLSNFVSALPRALGIKSFCAAP
jgi:hypothetical protein